MHKNIKKMHASLLLCVIIACCMTTVTSISCHSCESVYDSKCGADFELELNFQLDCENTVPPRYIENDLTADEHNATGCLKRIYKEGGVEKIVRSCFFGNVNDTAIGCRLDPSLVVDTAPECFVCDNEDYCNAAVMATWSQHLPLALTGALLVPGLTSILSHRIAGDWN